jgi:uncharacterized peroxidase-related enzyme
VLYRRPVPFIEAPHEDEWGEEFDSLKADVTDPVWRRADWIIRSHALDSGSMNAHHILYRQAMTGTATLRKVEREMIALIVSKVNDCQYCLTHHRRGLRRLLLDDALLQRIEVDFETAGLSPERLAMLRYAVKLTREPATVVAEDVDSLREVGFTDLDVLHIAEVVAYFAYANRIANGLGVPLEDWIPDE